MTANSSPIHPFGARGAALASTPTGFAARLWRVRLAASLALILALAGCATAPPHYPSQTAQRYVGKRLFDLEMRWSTPLDSSQSSSGRVAKWEFNQYNYAGCSVTVHTDAADIIRGVTWTRGCGPKGKKRAPRGRVP